MSTGSTDRGSPDSFDVRDPAGTPQSPPPDPQGQRHEVVRREPLRNRPNDRVTAAAAVVTGLASVVFALTVRSGTSVTVHGSALALALLALTLAVRRYFAGRFAETELAEPREVGAESDAALSDVQRVVRRPFVRRALLGAGVVLAAALLAPIAALGPRPRNLDRATPWRAGVRVVDPMGQPIAAEDVPATGLATVWPEGAEQEELAAAILVVLEREPLPPTVLDWVVDGRLVVYSKVCTHMGCPVGLFQSRTNTLFCPCHQASFDAAQGAVPVFGPVPRPLPQLPLGVDDQGYLVALGDFAEPVGPTVASS